MVSLDMLRAEQLGEAVTRSKIVLSGEERGELERRINATTVAVRDRQRAQIVVLSAAGMSQHQIAARVGVSRVTVTFGASGFSPTVWPDWRTPQAAGVSPRCHSRRCAWFWTK